MNEWIDARVLVKKAKEFHPRLAEPGLPSRIIRGLVKSEYVST